MLSDLLCCAAAPNSSGPSVIAFGLDSLGFSVNGALYKDTLVRTASPAVEGLGTECRFQAGVRMCTNCPRQVASQS